MADASKVKEAVEWYRQNRILYEALAKKVESIIREILDSKNVNYYSITSRTKSILRYKEKASKEKYKHPLSEIMDMAGIRVVTYTNSDAREVSEIIKETFNIYPQHSIDKAEELGVNRVGYRGIHYIGDLGKDRCKLPENRIFKEHIFEIQIRSMLQHGWAEFEHERNYKFAGVLPKTIQRRLFIAAANLESVDREFDSLSKEIDEYAEGIRESIEKGDLSEAINSASLSAYMNEKFEGLIRKDIVKPMLMEDDIIDELQEMGIKNLEELDKIFTEDIVKTIQRIYTKGNQATFYGILRYAMIIQDADRYFKKAWKKRWKFMKKVNQNFLSSYGVDVGKLANQYGIELD